MNILAFCFFPAFVPVSNGGQSRLYNFYKSLSKYHSITLLTSTHLSVKEEVVRHGVNFVERRIPKDNFFAEQYALLDKAGSGGDLSGPAIAAAGRYPTLLHKAYLEEYEHCDAVFHDFPFMVDYDLFAGIDNKLRVYNSHNCESELYKQLHPAAKSEPIHNLVSESEKKLLSLVDLVLYCNEADLASFHTMASDKKFDSLFAPNGMNPMQIDTLGEKSSRKKNAVFMGSGHPPNIKAAEFIVRKVAPKCPNLIFDFIGSCLPEGKYPSNVVRHGFVDDNQKKSILSRADLALNPMGEGSGSNVKVLEYFAYGIPVISTQFGMRGIHAKSGVEYIESDISEFVLSITSVIDQHNVLERIGNAGKKLAQDNYSWQSIADNVRVCVDGLVADKNQSDNKFLLVLNDYDSFAGVGGGCTRTQGLYNAAGEWCDVVFVCFSNEHTLSVRKHSEKITVITIPKSLQHQAENQHLNSQFHVSVDDIVSAMHAHQNEWLLSVYKRLREYARCIVVEHCYMTRIPLIFGDRFVHSSQNNETYLKSKLLEYHPHVNQLIQEVSNIERLAVERSALTIAVSDEDAQTLVVGKQASGPVITVPNGASISQAGEAVDELSISIRSELGRNPVVFLGSAHMPNIEAANHIVDVLAPALPEVTFNIVGSVCSGIQKAPNNVRLWGVVDDITKSAVMQSCLLALNPMMSGSGSNVKQADYFGNGLYVVSTAFGQRGYPESTSKHVSVVELDDFPTEIHSVLQDSNIYSDAERHERQTLFKRELSMQGLASRFVASLKGLEKKRKKVLYVAYRYTAPAQGGAELNMEKFISALGYSDEFDVDVIAPRVSLIHNVMRFGEQYDFDEATAAPVNIPNVRFARFSTDSPDTLQQFKKIQRAWSAQVVFEKVLNTLLADSFAETGLTYGWGYPESDSGRWAFNEFGVYLADAAVLTLSGYSPVTAVVNAAHDGAVIAGPVEVMGNFSIVLPKVKGGIDITVSNALQTNDPRPLSLRFESIKVDGDQFVMHQTSLIEKALKSLPGSEPFYILDKASAQSRELLNINLTDTRGPWSSEMEAFIADHIHEYDLVVAHNNVFRPAVYAMKEAKKNNIPSILIPHPHLDDDFYHFPDLLESARNASLVLAAPQAACEFYKSKGCNVAYMPAGCDADEEFKEEDKAAFQALYNSAEPFVLVLGRKAGAKNYHKVIEAVDGLNAKGTSIKVVLIGPDDDGVPINSTNAMYLGRQPRQVVRGALMSCVALINMSSSESFGIVLLEAWLAGKPVIANKDCVAFHDMAVHGSNALLVTFDDLSNSIMKVLDCNVAQDLANNGKCLVDTYAWSSACEAFVNICGDFFDSSFSSF